METTITIFAIVGAITLLWLLVKIIKWGPILLQGFLEAGFRCVCNPCDFINNFAWIIHDMEARGYKRGRRFDAGRDYPRLLMKNEETGSRMSILLDAPLLAEHGYSIIVTSRKNKTSIVMKDEESEENKRLLKKFLDLESEDKVQGDILHQENSQI